MNNDNLSLGVLENEMEMCIMMRMLMMLMMIYSKFELEKFFWIIVLGELIVIYI